MDAMGRAPQGSIAQVPSCGAGAEFDHSPNTYNTEALRCSLSSGALARRRLPLAGSVPDAIATYCLPLTSKVMGGAEKAEPILTFHNSSSEVSPKAATVPSIRPTKTRPPPVDSTPEKFGYGRWRFMETSCLLIGDGVAALQKDFSWQESRYIRNLFGACAMQAGFGDEELAVGCRLRKCESRCNLRSVA